MRDIAGRAATVIMVIAVLLGAASGTTAGAQTATGAATSLSAAELDAVASTLTTQLTGVEAQLLSSTEALARLQAEIAVGREAYLVGLDAENATRASLARYSVAVYMVGEIVPPDVTDAMLTSGVGDLEVQGRRVLATTVHAELTGGARRATADLDGVVARLDRDEAEASALDARLAELGEEKLRIAAEVDATRAEAARARSREQAEAAEVERRRIEDDLRAGTPRPESQRTGVVPSPTVRAEIIARLGGEIPPIALDAYWRAAGLTNAGRPGCAIDWALLAAVGRVETNHGTYRGAVVAPDGSTTPTIIGIPLDGSRGTAVIRDTDGGALDGDPVYDRAVGPMQFIPGTWRAYAVDGNGDGIADPHNIYDSAFAAGNYLCSSARGPISNPENASRAVFAYNRSTAYNIEVLTLADHYRRVLDPTLPVRTPVTVAPPDPGELPPPASPDVPKDPDPPTTTTTTSPTTSPPSTSTTTTTQA